MAFETRHSGGSRNPFCVWPLALRENRLTSVCGSSTIHGRRLLSFACPKESNQRKRHPRIRALAFGEGSLRADGFGPQAIHGLLSESARSIAPPACGARGFSVRPPPLLRGNPKSKSQWIPAFAGMTAWGVSHISGASAAGTAALCSSRAPLGRGERVEETAACTARGRAQDARASDLGTGMCRERTPEPARVVTRAGMPA